MKFPLFRKMKSSFLFLRPSFSHAPVKFSIYCTVVIFTWKHPLHILLHKKTRIDIFTLKWFIKENLKVFLKQQNLRRKIIMNSQHEKTPNHIMLNFGNVKNLGHKYCDCDNFLKNWGILLESFEKSDFCNEILKLTHYSEPKCHFQNIQQIY